MTTPSDSLADRVLSQHEHNESVFAAENRVFRDSVVLAAQLLEARKALEGVVSTNEFYLNSPFEMPPAVVNATLEGRAALDRMKEMER